MWLWTSGTYLPSRVRVSASVPGVQPAQSVSDRGGSYGCIQVSQVQHSCMAVSQHPPIYKKVFLSLFNILHLSFLCKHFENGSELDAIIFRELGGEIRET